MHRHAHSHAHTDATGDLRLAFFLNLGFTVIEIVGGFWTNSVAILSDAVHDLGDSLSLGAAWYLDRVSQRKSNRRFSYGYRRFSLLGAWANVTVLLAGSVLVLSEAIPRLFEPQTANAAGMLGFAVLGVVVNGAAALRLRGRHSLNARVAAWHLVEDILGWLAVLVVAIVLLVVDLPVLDPALSIAITGYILFNVIRNLRHTMLLFLQAVPEDIDLAVLEERLGALAHVQSTHHTHVWSMDGDHHVLTTHIVVDANASRADVSHLREEAAELCREYRFAHTTIEIEWEDDTCRMEQPAAAQ